ncbi:amidohydrolase family protein [Steroidobacter sp.]|uniref:amidohydrolase family protein n=1 Tax=Steroidobacter sp. TaxID=1978227 RepID=UPI0025E69EE4|nr:amidohydrolase family protein [Steroidobacter sp.]
MIRRSKLSPCWLLLMMMGSAAQAAEGPEQRDYIWFTAGEPSGAQQVKVAADRISVHWSFNDRGRGPDLTAEMSVDGQGRLTGFTATGVNYSKGKVDERFTIEAGNASWRSTLERGTAPVRPGYIYYPVNQPPEFRGQLARELLAQPNHQLKLLPAGEARIESLETRTFSVEGKSRKATLYAISGLDLMPVHVWLDEQQTLVGYNDGWFAVLRDGWKEHLPSIKAAQEAQLAKHISAQTERFRHTISQPIVIVNARVLDVSTGRLSEPTSVLVRDGLIADIGSKLSTPKGAHIVDAKGKTLMPSLWDMHGHIGPDQYLHYIASGVLNVRDMGNDPPYLVQLRAEIAAGTVASPDIYSMGFIDKRSPFSAPTGRLAATLDEARAAERAYAKEGAVGIKLYSSIDPEWVPVLTKEARSLHLGVAGHIPSFMSPEQAIRDGYSELTHINMMLLQLIGDWSIDTRTPQRFIATGERGGLIDLDGPPAKKFIDLMLERRVAHDPTLAIFMNMYESRAGEVIPSARAYADHLPAGMRRDQIADVSYNNGKEEAFRRTGEVALKLIKRMHDRGVRILPGTDTSLPGFALISELQFYARAGISNADVLRLATLEPARHLGREAELGSVTVGKKAHLMLVDGDPTQDLAALRRVEQVFKGNAMFKSREILQAQGITPFGNSSVAGSAD